MVMRPEIYWNEFEMLNAIQKHERSVAHKKVLGVNIIGDSWTLPKHDAYCNSVSKSGMSKLKLYLVLGWDTAIRSWLQESKRGWDFLRHWSISGRKRRREANNTGNEVWFCDHPGGRNSLQRLKLTKAKSYQSCLTHWKWSLILRMNVLLPESR